MKSIGEYRRWGRPNNDYQFKSAYVENGHSQYDNYVGASCRKMVK